MDAGASWKHDEYRVPSTETGSDILGNSLPQYRVENVLIWLTINWSIELGLAIRNENFFKWKAGGRERKRMGREKEREKRMSQWIPYSVTTRYGDRFHRKVCKRRERVVVKFSRRNGPSGRWIILFCSCWYSEKMLTQVTIGFRQTFNLSLERGVGLKLTQIEHTGTDFTFKNGIR